MSSRISESVQVPFDMGNKRLDQVAAALFSDYSRSRLQQWIKDGQLTVNGETKRGRDKLVGGEQLRLEAELVAEGDWEAQPIPLDIVFEDEHILVINKQADLVVHPAAGNPDGTLLNGLLYHAPQLAEIPRAGIVHRLDKDTTGLMVVAKTLQAQAALVAQLQDRSMGREYEAVVQGHMTGGGKVDEPIGRHGTQRTKMAVNPMGKEAVTHYRVLHKFPSHTYIRCKLETGRTHQIRVHLSHIGYPLVGDATYAARTRLVKGIGPTLRNLLQTFGRQALHARALGLIHPATQEWMEWEVELPDDFLQLLECLDEDANAADLAYFQLRNQLPDGVGVCVTTRQKGLTQPPFGYGNLALHVGDDAGHVALNRQRLLQQLPGVSAIQWLQQIHGIQCDVAMGGSITPACDAVFTREPGIACAVLTADCLPVLLMSDDGQEVAAVHAGWRGLANGAIATAVERFSLSSRLKAVIGPAIGFEAFEIGVEVREAFANAPEYCFRTLEGDKYLADLHAIAEWQLECLGIQCLSGLSDCTVRQNHQFYSYRKEGQTGRIACLIWRRR